MFTSPKTTLYQGLQTSEPLELEADGEPVQVDQCQIVLSRSGKTNIRCYGNGIFIVSNTVLSCDADFPDSELVSVGEGANIYFYRCRFQNSDRGILIGSNEHREETHSSISATFVECVFEDIGKWNPFARYGQIRLFRCLVKNWGKPGFSSSDGFLVGKHAQGLAGSCVFIQKPLLSCLNKGTLQEMFRGFPLLVPGFAKAAHAEYGGQIRLYNCYKNRWWLYIKNHYGKYMTQEEATELETHIESVVPKLSK